MKGPDGYPLYMVFVCLDELVCEEPDHPVAVAYKKLLDLNEVGRCPHCDGIIDKGSRVVTEDEVDERAVDLFGQEFYLRVGDAA